ncbi:hypothetical protein H9Q74_001411 [Fusarium xylarioides]|nr:hypothetical protein H9Q71_010359 [Fusarium xylarioides]KAG5828502.1 hypothetical protein H9Q74_001411 [Fusarium xylarioides]
MNSPTYIGLYEKLDLAENLQKWVKAVHPELYSNTPPEEVSLSAEDRENFFYEVFNDWSSAADIEDMPRKPRDRDKDGTCILIGRWSQDLPASKNKRKREEDGESPTKRRKRDEVRRRHQPAYFGVGISSGKGEDKVSFDIKDDSNQIAAAQYVEWSTDTDGDIEDLKRRGSHKM